MNHSVTVVFEFILRVHLLLLFVEFEGFGGKSLGFDPTHLLELGHNHPL